MRRSALYLLAITACSSPEGFTIDRITPASGANTDPVPVRIDGTNVNLPIQSSLDNGTTTIRTVGATIGDVPLAETALRDAHIEAEVPSGLVPGVYDVTVRLGERTAVLAGGYEVLAPVAGDAGVDAGPERVTDGLVAYYTFEEGTGTTVLDRSGVAPALDLEIASASTDLVTWATGTLTVTGETLIASPGAATKILDACRASDAVTLEAWLTPATATAAYLPRVVTVSSSNSDLAVTLMTLGTHYELRMYGPMTDTNGLPSLNTADGTVVVGTPVHVVLVSEPGGARRIYVDGVERAADMLGGDLSAWGPQHRIALANELDGGRAWLGTYDTVAIYARALTAAEIEQNRLAGPR
jgi:hypothetical protein